MNMPRTGAIRVVEKSDGRKDIVIDEASRVIALDAKQLVLGEITVDDYRPSEVLGSLHVQQPRHRTMTR